MQNALCNCVPCVFSFIEGNFLADCIDLGSEGFWRIALEEGQGYPQEKNTRHPYRCYWHWVNKRMKK